MKMFLAAVLIVALAAFVGLSVGVAGNMFLFPTMAKLFKG